MFIDLSNLYVLGNRFAPLKRIVQSKKRFEYAPTPKNIWAYWHDGWEGAPELIKYCINSWEEKNKRWAVHKFDYQSICKEFPELLNVEVKYRAHFADIVRLKLLRKHGGVWVDATALCARELDEWLPLVKSSSPVFVFSNPAPDRAVANWFIAASVGSRAIAQWQKITAKHLVASWRYKTYYSTHYLFKWLVSKEALVKQEFNAMAKVSAQSAFVLEAVVREKTLNGAQAELIRSAPIHKLSRKSRYGVADYRMALKRAYKDDFGVESVRR